ncbi:MAG: ArsB/NhaD family transporter [Candidatus Planktophila sp.]|jgi:anion transporter|tara:strand:+ start:703 stop:1983 length:1281 start_codon:yes stop_codon:yes gene_type:complete
MQMALAISIFVIAYIFIASEKISRIAIALAGAAAMIVVGATDADKAFYSHETGVDWNVIFLLLGMMIIVGVIHKTGLFEFLAVTAIKKSKGSPKVALVYLMLLTAVASAILDNVTTILLAVPMTLIVTRHLQVSPIPFILAEVFVSNIGGAATLVGDPPNIIIASKADLTFNDFLTHMAPMVILVLIVVIPLIIYLFRVELVNSASARDAVMKLDARTFLKDRVLLKKSVSVLSLVMVAFIGHSLLHLEPSIVALLGAGILVAISGLKPSDYVQDVEWSTLVFFAGLFIMVGGLVNVGALEHFSKFLTDLFDGDIKLAAGTILGVSAVLSGIVDNIPYVASMSPVVADLSLGLVGRQENVLWWSLAFGSDFGGNATIIGASANVVAIGLAARAGVHISFWKFSKYGVIVTAVSVALIYPYILWYYF